MAQSIKVKESNSDFSVAQNVNSLVVEIPYVSQDFVEGKIKKLFKGFGKHKESKKEHVAMMVELKDFGKMPFNAYGVSSVSNNDIVSVRFGFDLGGAFLNSKDHPEKYKVIEKIIEDFASKSVKTWVEGIVREENKRLNNLEKDQKDLVKRKEHLEKEIKDFEKKIADNKNSIKENLDSQSAKKTEIETQIKQVGLVEKQLKSLR
jgi:molecular chaperone DnaK (HSP70)